MREQLRCTLTQVAAVLICLLLPDLAVAADPRIYNQLPPKKPKAIAEDDATRVTPELEEQLVDMFSNDRCDRVRAAISRKLEQRLSPLVASVVAYCQLDPLRAEELFGWAEAQEPNRDTIYVLHARYRWKLNPETALPLWAKVALITRNPGTKVLAQQYLAGLAEGDELIDVGATANLFLNLQLGTTYETNPLGAAVSETNPSSGALTAQATALYTRNTDYGTFSAGYSLLNNRYFNAHSADLLEHDVEVPVALRAGTNEDVVFRPFASYLMLGDQGYQMFAGAAVRGVAYRRFYKQYVQGTIYRDWYFRQEYKPQAGTHFRFDYNWELFPFPWFFNAGAYVEHVSAEHDNDDVNSLSITYSHTDFGVQLYSEHNLRLCTPGWLVKSYVREDADISSYTSLFGEQVHKRRQDIAVELTPSLTVPLEPNIHLYGYFTYSRIFSNIGQNDYTDRNIVNRIVGVSLKIYLIK